jgi:vitamin B12 transporter
LEPVVITPARSEQKLPEVLAPVTLITREDIERSQAQSLPELLSRQAGLQMTRTGGPGSQTSLWARGAGSSGVLVLIDGMRLNTPLTGAAVLGGVNVATIERIEIVRGNMSSLYGSEAIGGVVQIFTRGGTADAASVQAEAGSGDSINGAASVTRNFGGTRLSATVAGARSKPFSAIDPSQAPGANPDDDGHRNASGVLRLQQRVGEATELGASVWTQRNKTDFDDPFDAPFSNPAASRTAQQKEDSRATNWQAFGRHQLDEVWVLRATLGEVTDKSKNTSTIPFSYNSNEYEARNRQAQLQADAKLAERVIASFGFDYLNQRGESTGYDPSFNNVLTGFSRNARSYWLGINGRADKQQVQLNLRHDDYSDVGDATTGLAAYGYQLTEQLRVILQASSAFRAPSFNDLYFPFFGNPALEPEEARSVEAGLRYARGDWRAGLAVFNTRTENLIQYSPATRRAENIARAKVRGVELTLGWQHAPWRVDFNATYLDTEDEATGQRLLRRAPFTANLAAYYDGDRWAVGGELGHADKRADGDINTFARIDLAAYTVARLVASYELTKALRLKLRVENAFDEDYELVDGYNTWGRAVFGGIEWRM